MDFKTNLLEFLSLDEADKLIGSLNNEDYHAVLLNTEKMNDEMFLSLYPNVRKHPYVEHGYIFDKKEYQLGKSLWHELGCFYMQEPSAMIVSSLIDVKENNLVLDMCAAPGGKSIGLSFKMNQNGLIISNDISRNRTNLIIENSERLGLKNLLIINNNFEKIYSKYIDKFDAIILDAPCSGSGMFRKDDKMINDWSINKVYKYAVIQKKLIEIAYKMLKPGGVLSYSTCSYSIGEDEDVVEHLLNNSDAEIIEIKNIQNAYANPKKPLGIRMLPSLFEGEGQYICQIKKPGTKKDTTFLNANKFRKTLPDICENKDVVKYGQTYFCLNNATKLYDLNVVRYGVKIGEESKGIFKYDLHFARSLKKEQFNSIELNEKEVKDYLLGNVINKENPFKGYVLLTYMDIPIDIAKSDTHQIKNYYPKGLRKKII